jgi:hypothetical protein
VIAVTTGVGCTVIVNVFVGPGQVTAAKVYLGVMVMVAISGVVPAFVAAKAVMFPVPLAPRPMPVLLLVQS